MGISPLCNAISYLDYIFLTLLSTIYTLSLSNLSAFSKYYFSSFNFLRV